MRRDDDKDAFEKNRAGITNKQTKATSYQAKSSVSNPRDDVIGVARCQTLRGRELRPSTQGWFETLDLGR